MILDKSKKWVDAGINLAKDQNAKVLCPECESDDLIVQDIQSPICLDDFERIIRCPLCGAYNAIRLKRLIGGIC